MTEEIHLGRWETGKKCPKCGGNIIMRNKHRFPYEIIIECEKCNKRFKVEPT